MSLQSVSLRLALATFVAASGCSVEDELDSQDTTADAPAMRDELPLLAAVPASAESSETLGVVVWNMLATDDNITMLGLDEYGDRAAEVEYLAYTTAYRVTFPVEASIEVDGEDLYFDGQAEEVAWQVVALSALDALNAPEASGGSLGDPRGPGLTSKVAGFRAPVAYVSGARGSDEWSWLKCAFAAAAGVATCGTSIWALTSDPATATCAGIVLAQGGAITPLTPPQCLGVLGVASGIACVRLVIEFVDNCI